MINSRALAITGTLMLIMVLLVIKLFSIQITKHEYYSLIAERQQNNPTTTKAERGLIEDSNGEVLSFTRDDISFFVDKRMMTKDRIDTITTKFAETFGKSNEYYKKLISDGSGNVLLEKKAPMSKVFNLKKLVVDGFKVQEDYSRVYEYGSLASHLLGFVNPDMVGVEGIEKCYNKDLTGIDGNYTIERDVIGRVLSVDEKISKAAVPGKNIILTINKTYQKILEEELTAGLEKYGGLSAVGIVMNPNTGEIFALANLPNFDPANYELFPAEARRNLAITDTYEPGSTMKSIMMSILLDQNLVNPDEIINTENGTFSYKGKVYHDAHKFPALNVEQIIVHSSDIGMIKLSERLNNDILYKYIRDFGFTNKTLIDLPGEAEGSFKKPSAFSGLTKASLSFGYEISVTPLQMITAYCALINGGNLFQPFVVKQITDETGKVVETFPPKKIRTVINNSTSELIKKFMVGVVEHGTATAAQLENVLVGGKTGTSEMYQSESGSYSESKHNSSFIGFFPSDNPNVVCLILVTSPQKAKFGGDVAAPIFREVAKKMILTDMNLAPNKKKIERKQNLIDQLVADIKTAPKTKTTSFAHPAEKLFANNSSRLVFDGNKTIMPNLISQSLRDAVAQLTELGLQPKITGTGKVIWQSLEPGSNINPGLVCQLKCESSIKKIAVSPN